MYRLISHIKQNQINVVFTVNAQLVPLHVFQKNMTYVVLEKTDLVVQMFNKYLCVFSAILRI